MTRFYDTNGSGYVSFQIGDGKGILSLPNVTYFKVKDDPGTLITRGPKDNELYNAWKNSGCEYGTTFKGEDTGLFPNNPDGRWS